MPRLLPFVLLFVVIWISGGPLLADEIMHRGLGPAPDSLDLHRGQSLAALNVLRDLHEGLVTVAADGRLIPGLARSWTVSSDGLRWRFELDDAARWSDGQAITAADFVSGWRRLVDPVTASPHANWLAVIDQAPAIVRGQQPAERLGVWAEGPSVLQIQLTRPAPWLPELLAHPAAGPWPGAGRRRYSGAFELLEEVPGAHLRLGRNRQFRAAELVGLDEVIWHVIEEPVVEMNRYRAGELHITETIPPGRLSWLREKFGDQLRIAPYLGSYFLVFNLARGPFVDKPGLRRALSLVIDRELLTRRVLGGGEIPAWRLVPPGLPSWPAGDSSLDGDFAARLQQAQVLYRQAGYHARRPLSVELRLNTSLTQRRTAAAVAAMWRQHLGVRTRIVHEEWKVFIVNRRQGRLTEIVRGGWIADRADPVDFLKLFATKSPLNYAFWSDPEFDQHLRQAESLDGTRRIEHLQQAEQRLLDQQVIVPLYYYVSRHLVHPDVRGFEDNPMDIHLSRWLRLQ